MPSLEFTPRKTIVPLTLPRQKATVADDDDESSGIGVDSKIVQADSFEKSSTSKKQTIASPEPQKTNWLPWALGVAGAITIGGIFGSLLYFNAQKKKPVPSPASVAQAVSTVSNPPPAVGTPIKRTMQQVKDLCTQVMVPSNGGAMGCQTMAFFNSLRLYQQLAKTEAGFDQSGHLPKIDQLLGKHSPEVLMKKAFEFCRKLPDTEALSKVIDHVESPTTVAIDPLEGALTKLIPHFLSQYAFGKAQYSLSTFKPIKLINSINQRDMAKTLQGLCDGKIGLLASDGGAGGHMVSLVGIHELEKGAISDLISKLQKKGISTRDAELLLKVELLIYDQALADQKQEAFCRLPLSVVFQSTTAQQFFHIKLFQQETPINYRYEPILRTIASPKNFTSPAYHQKLMEAGDAVFR